MKALKASSERRARACIAATERVLRAKRQWSFALLCATSAPGLSSGHAQIGRSASSLELTDLARRSEHQKQYTKYTTELHKRDRDLNTMTLRTLAEIFMAMAFFAFMAIFVLIIGRFVASSAGNVVPSTPESLGRQFLETHGDPECVIEDKMANVEFIGYGSWDAFSSACCCRDRNDTAAGEVELWTCPDRQEAGAVMHKQRTRVGVVEGERRSALHLRAFCAAQFEPGVVGPSYNATAKAYGVRNASEAGAEEWLLLW